MLSLSLNDQHSRLIEFRMRWGIQPKSPITQKLVYLESCYFQGGQGMCNVKFLEFVENGADCRRGRAINRTCDYPYCYYQVDGDGNKAYISNFYS